MKIRTKANFFMVLGMSLMAFSSAPAATANSSAGPNPSATDTNVNLNTAMTALFGNPVIVKGKGFEVKQSDLDEAMTGIKAAAAMRNQVIPPAQMKMLESQMLDRLIQVQLLLQKATDADKAAGKKMADSQMKTLLERAGSQEALNRQFTALGMSMGQLRARLTQEGTAQAALLRELKVTVTDDEAKKYYDDHPADFEQPDMVRIAQIFLSTHDPVTGAELSDTETAAKKKEMDDILKRARAGENFSNLVEQYSEDVASKDKGGIYTIARGQTPPEIEAAAFSLNTNQISDVVSTTIGYHIIKLLAKIPAKKLAYDSILPNQTPPDALKVSDYIKTQLTNQKAAKLAPAYVAALRKEAGVEILDPDLKTLELESESEAGTNAPAAGEGK
ncbi:MAG TPA: peptidylprolyl isomerase [Candidatus Acidoferrales bacterium]|nr:peptidylprolyl isomerase [Candidatus Acidoferrales bacterium]